MSDDAICEIDISQVARVPRLRSGSVLEYEYRGHGCEFYSNHFHSHELFQLIFQVPPLLLCAGIICPSFSYVPSFSYGSSFVLSA